MSGHDHGHGHGHEHGESVDVVAARDRDGTVVSGAGIPAGAIVELRSERGRLLHARVAAATASDGERPAHSYVELDAEQRRILGVGVGSQVTVASIDLPVAESVRLVPAFAVDMRAELVTQVREWLIAAAPALSTGLRLRLQLPDGGIGGVFYVASVSAGTGRTATVGPQTAITVSTPTLQQLTDLANTVTMDAVAGMHRVIPLLRSAIEMPLMRPEVYDELEIFPPRGVLLHGAPGVGKTHVARALCATLGVSIHPINGPELVSGSYGQTEANLREVFARAALNAPAVVLIDEIDAVAPRRSQIGTQADYRTVTQLMTLMDGLRNTQGVVVVATTNRPQALDPALRRPGRLDSEVYVAPPSPEERLEILRHYTDRMPLTEEARAHVVDVADRAHGYVPADLMALAREAGLAVLRRGGMDTAITELIVHPHDLDAALEAVSPSLLRGATIRKPEATFADFTGRPEALDIVAKAVAGAPDGGIRLLLNGPAGTGKASLAQGIAENLGVHLINVTPTDVFSSWLGESEEALSSLFATANMSRPIVLSLSNLEVFAPREIPHDAGATRRLVDQLIHELDNADAEVTFVAATRSVANIDPGVLRRFTHVVDTGPEPGSPV